MRKGTFSVEKANSNSSAHNSRENSPRYLIGLEDGEENYYELIKSDSDFILEAKRIYKKTTGQDMQKAYTISKGKRKGTFVSAQEDNLIQETILTLKKNQNQNDVKELFKKLNKKYGGHEILEVSVHRDEGHYEKNGIAYYPTKNILEKDDGFYTCSDYTIEEPKENDFDTKVNINEFKKVYNYHSHVKFSMFDRDLGKSATMQKKDMSSRIKFVSDELGLAYDPKNRSRTTKSVNQIKDEHFAKARGQEKVRAVAVAKIKDLNAEIAQLKQEMIDSKNASKEDYQVLRETNKELKVEIKAKNLTVDQLQHNIQELREELISTKKENEHLKSVVELKDIEIIELKETIKATNVSTVKEKRASEQTIEHLKFKNITLEQQTEEFQRKIDEQARKIKRLEDIEPLTVEKEIIKTVENPIDTKLQEKVNRLNKSFENLVVDFSELLGIKKVFNMKFFDAVKEKINSVLNQNKSLQEQNKALEVKVHDLEEKNVSRPNMSDLKDNEKELFTEHSNEDRERAMRELLGHGEASESQDCK